MAPHRRTMVFKVIPDPEGGLSARAAERPIFIQGNTIAELRQNADDAIQCHFGGNDMPPEITFQFDDAESQVA